MNLRELTRYDSSVGMISAANCLLIAAALEVVIDLCNGIFIKYLVPRSLRENALNLRMLAATLGRTPDEKRPLAEKIAAEMEKARG